MDKLAKLPDLHGPLSKAVAGLENIYGGGGGLC